MRYPKLVHASYDPMIDAVDVIPAPIFDMVGSDDAATIADAEARSDILIHAAVDVLKQAHALHIDCDQGLFVAASDWPAAIDALEAAEWVIRMHHQRADLRPV